MFTMKYLIIVFLKLICLIRHSKCLNISEKINGTHSQAETKNMVTFTKLNDHANKIVNTDLSLQAQENNEIQLNKFIAYVLSVREDVVDGKSKGRETDRSLSLARDRIYYDRDQDLLPSNLDRPFIVLNINDNSALQALIDSALEVARRKLNATFPLANVSETFSHRIYNIIINGEFKGEDGYLKNLNTIQRKGNFTLEKVNRVITGNIIFGFEELSIHFNKFHIKSLRMEIEGLLDIIIKENAFLLRFGILLNDTKCAIEVIPFHMIALEEIKVHKKGEDSLINNYILKTIANFVIERTKNDVKDRVEKRINKVMREVVKSYESKLCGFFREISKDY